jgi:methylmalonyl-CoA/ethylmalonyl-CoA epimerase
MKIDHICFAVKSISDGITYWEAVFGYRQMTEVIENSLQKVKVCFLCKEESMLVKLIEPLADNQSLVNFVNRGGGFHHLCFRVEDMDKQISELKEKGLLMLVPPQPGEAFNNHSIAFMLAKYGTNIEIIDSDEKAGLIK